MRLDRGRGRGAASGAGRPVLQVPAGAPARTDGALGRGCGLVLAVVLAIFLIARCSSDAPDATGAAGNSAQAALSEPAYVSARSLNCRRQPDAAASVAEGLRRDEQVVVAERRDDWARLTRTGGDCWVSGAFLAPAPAGTGSGAGGSRQLLSSGAGTTAAAAGGAYVAGRAVASSGRKARASKRRRSSRSRRGGGGAYFGSGCPCSGSQVCIGPRGGRYCITSGGNKRYGV